MKDRNTELLLYRLLDEVAVLRGHVLRLVRITAHNEEKIMSALSDLQAAVAAEDTVIGSAVTLLNAIPGLIAAAGTDPAALAALQSDIQARTQDLANAVVTGTPAAPPSSGT